MAFKRRSTLYGHIIAGSICLSAAGAYVVELALAPLVSDEPGIFALQATSTDASLGPGTAITQKFISGEVIQIPPPEPVGRTSYPVKL